jgi:amidase
VADEVLAAADSDTRAAFNVFLARLAASDDPPTFMRIPIGDLDEYLEPFRTVQAAEAWRNNGEWLSAHPGALDTTVAERFRFAASVPAEEEASARIALAPMRTHGRERIDAVRTATLRMTTPAAVAGLPALSVPLLTLQSQLGPAPVGVSLVSRADSDIALVRTARRLARLAAPRYVEDAS